MKPGNLTDWSSNRGPTLWGILFSPTEQFERMIERPRFGWALTVMMLAGALTAGVAGYSAVLEMPLPDEVRMLDSGQIAVTVGIFSFVSGLVGVPVMLLFITLIQKLFMMLFQGEATYRQLFSLNTHLYLLTLIADLIMAVLLLVPGLRGDAEVYPTSLAALVPAEGALKWILNGIEVFALWKLFLTARGLSILGRLSSGKAWTIALILFAGGLFFSALVGWFTETAEIFQFPQD